MKTACTGVILAGGQNKRFDGQNKALLRISGRRIIDRLIAVYTLIFDQIVLVTNDPAPYMDIDALIVSDHYDERSSLNGLHAGLYAAAHEHAFFCACDTPFIQGALIQHIVDQIDRRADLIIPVTSAGYEPMFAVYGKTCLSAMAWQLDHDRLKIQGIFPKVRLKTVAEADLRAKDPELISFFNINTPEDLAKAEALDQAWF